jgi:hypothetical protein
MLRPILLLTILGLASCQFKNKNETDSNTSMPKAASSNSDKRITNALAFLNAYVENCNKGKNQVSAVEWANSSKLVTAHFKTGVKKLEDEALVREPIVGLDADPIFDARFFPEKGFEFESMDGTTGYLIFKGKDDQKFKVTVKMVNEFNNWLVDGCGMVNIPDDKRPEK